MADPTPEGLGVTLDGIRRARETIRPYLHHTPTLSATRLGEPAGVRLHVKAEMLQKTGSFKPRGSLCVVAALSPAERAAGVITMSAGNHGQGLAFAARAAGVACTIVTAEHAPRSKVEAMRGYGAEVVQVPFAEMHPTVMRLQAERGMTFVHPFANPHLVTGYGTLALEVLEAVPDLDVVLVPVGGGGLISGVALAFKESRPSVRVVGVEPEGAPSIWRSLREGHAVKLDRIDTIAEGLAPPFADEFNLRFVRRYVDDVILVSDDEIRAALRAVLTWTKLVVEPSGAASVAALDSGRAGIRPGDRAVCLLTGGNVDLARLKELL